MKFGLYLFFLSMSTGLFAPGSQLQPSNPLDEGVTGMSLPSDDELAAQATSNYTPMPVAAGPVDPEEQMLLGELKTRVIGDFNEAEREFRKAEQGLNLAMDKVDIVDVLAKKAAERSMPPPPPPGFAPPVTPQFTGVPMPPTVGRGGPSDVEELERQLKELERL